MTRLWDILLIAGFVMVVAGLACYDWRLSLVIGGTALAGFAVWAAKWWGARDG